ncbi:MAG: LysR family transcriptional regulator [Clostridia bacterium]|nr:LysR family transcriptional regulator [Clostridia bacterium]
MNTDVLLTFTTLARVKKFTAAAEQLFVAQATVTNRIAELENEVGKKLFVRSGRGVELTEEGAVFLEYARRMLDLEDAALSAVSSASRYKEKLRVGAVNAVYESKIYSLVKAFVKAYPAVSIKVSLGHTLDLLQRLQDNVDDVVFSYVPLKRTGYICREFDEDKLLLVCSSALTQYKGGIKEGELADLNYLMCNFALSDVGMFIRSLFPPRYTFGFEIDNSTKLLDYLKDGLGYSFAPESLVSGLIKDGTLIEIPLLDFSAPTVKSYCIYRQEKTEIVEKFLGN